MDKNTSPFKAFLYGMGFGAFLMFLLLLPTTVQASDENGHAVCLAKNIYFEARSESTAGRIAVSWTVINRVRHKRFPNSVCEVVEQGLKYENGFPKRNKCQFSWYCDGQPDIIRNVNEWRDAYRLASYVSTGRDHLVDITDGSLWYHADYVYPKWAKHKRKTAKIDTHIFYR